MDASMVLSTLSPCNSPEVHSNLSMVLLAPFYKTGKESSWGPLW